MIYNWDDQKSLTIDDIELAKHSLIKRDIDINRIKTIIKVYFCGGKIPSYKERYDDDYYASGRIVAYLLVKSGFTYGDLLGERHSISPGNGEVPNNILLTHLEIDKAWHYETSKKFGRKIR